MYLVVVVVVVHGMIGQLGVMSATEDLIVLKSAATILASVSVFEFFLQETHDNMTKAQNQWLLFFCP